MFYSSNNPPQTKPFVHTFGKKIVSVTWQQNKNGNARQIEWSIGWAHFVFWHFSLWLLGEPENERKTLVSYTSFNMDDGLKWEDEDQNELTWIWSWEEAAETTGSGKDNWRANDEVLLMTFPIFGLSQVCLNLTAFIVDTESSFIRSFALFHSFRHFCWQCNPWHSVIKLSEV